MKGKRIALCLFTALTGIGLVVLLCCRAGNAIFSVDSYQLTINPLISFSSKKILKEIIAQHYSNSFEQLSQQLQNACPAIKNVCVRRCADHQLKIYVDLHQPFMQIGQTALLLENGSVVGKHHYKKQSIEDLACLQIPIDANPFAISKELISWLQQLDEHIVKEFSINWNDDYQIYLQHKQMRTHRILAGVGTPVNGEIVQVCKQIVDHKINLEQGTARALWCADIRFDKQIIVSSHKGGACHG